MENFIIAAAQTNPIKGDIETNIRNHVEFIEIAAEHKADVIIFPELSLTGYEPELAEQLGVEINDERFTQLTNLSIKHNMIISAGAPIKNPDGKPYLGLLSFNSNGTYLYLKQHLHPGEEMFFSYGSKSGIIEVKGETIGLAICADIAKESHPEIAANNGASIYAASVFISPGGYTNDTSLLQKFAIQYRMAIVMANYCGMSGGMESAGRSAIWDEKGELIVQANALTQELIIAERKLMKWIGKRITISPASG